MAPTRVLLSDRFRLEECRRVSLALSAAALGAAALGLALSAAALGAAALGTALSAAADSAAALSLALSAAALGAAALGLALSAAALGAPAAIPAAILATAATTTDASSCNSPRSSGESSRLCFPWMLQQ